jgi:hypothetical protein
LEPLEEGALLAARQEPRERPLPDASVKGRECSVPVDRNDLEPEQERKHGRRRRARERLGARCRPSTGPVSPSDQTRKVELTIMAGKNPIPKLTPPLELL